jgi:copper chaperone
MTSLTLSIRGMSCGHCVKHVEKALADLDGVTTREVRIGEATVEFDAAKQTADAIAAAVTEAGYDATPAGQAA